MKEVLDNPSAQENAIDSSSIMAASKVTKYKWDGVNFVKGSGIKYPHPNYDLYSGEIYQTWYLSGTKLKHCHIDNNWSGKLVSMAPAVAGAVIGARLGGAWGAAAGTILGLLLDGVVASVVLDEEGCLWYWYAKSFGWYPLPTIPPSITYAPKYCRIGSYTIWNFLGISNP